MNHFVLSKRSLTLFSTISTVKVSINVGEVLWLKLGISINSWGLFGVLIKKAFLPVGEYNLSSVGPNKPKVGIPVAADKCIKPESFQIKIFDYENTAAVDKIGLPI